MLRRLWKRFTMLWLGARARDGGDRRLHDDVCGLREHLPERLEDLVQSDVYLEALAERVAAKLRPPPYVPPPIEELQATVRRLSELREWTRAIAEDLRSPDPAVRAAAAERQREGFRALRRDLGLPEEDPQPPGDRPSGTEPEPASPPRAPERRWLAPGP